MAKTRRSVALRFINQYSRDFVSYKRAARQAAKAVRRILKDHPAEIHLISARAKSIDSLRLKAIEKRYATPAKSMTDQIGVRVITYYESDVNSVADALRGALEIDLHNSADKRTELNLREFGYLSVHLIARLKGMFRTSKEFADLGDKWFEIQVRSVLEHAWAEIEHEVVYKSRMQYPDVIRRRFARLAGAIELLEDEFAALKKHRDTLIDDCVSRIRAKAGLSEELDAAHLIAVMEIERPLSTGWRAARESGQPYLPKIEALCVRALKSAGIKTVASLRNALRNERLRNAEKQMATALTGPVSHLATILLVVLLRSKAIFMDYFPQMIYQPGIQQLLERQGRARKKKRTT